uniref:Uncharacterized protein n=1 Tax=Trypanosoma vivax (strain Y486) TaxID=1055687 RepID=G0U355_TRYVY|nr:conserved hypothetical protein [Trypanosoma vivax Y486]
MQSPCLPLALRQRFLDVGYAIFPQTLDTAFVGKLRESLIASTTARSRYFIEFPDIETLLQSKAKLSDPLYTKIMTRLQRRKRVIRQYQAERQRRRYLSRVAASILKGRKREELSGEELWRLSEILSEEVAKMSGKGCQSTIHNDPQMLRAINEYRCNVWMTNKGMESIVRDPSFVHTVGKIATHIGGVERPVLFSDAPMFREPYGNPFGYHCTAPTIGVKTNLKSSTAVSLLVFTHRPDSQSMPLYVLKNSHRFVRQQLGVRVSHSAFTAPFLPMEAHIPEQLKRFEFDDSVVGVPMEDSHFIGPGTIVALDPHLMIAMGMNASTSCLAVYKMNIVSENAKPFMQAPSWITAWRSLRGEVSFASPVVFPPLYSATAISAN